MKSTIFTYLVRDNNIKSNAMNTYILNVPHNLGESRIMDALICSIPVICAVEAALNLFFRRSIYAMDPAFFFPVGRKFN